MSSKLLYKQFQDHQIVWEQTCLAPFDELMISWCAKRPEKLSYRISTQILQNGQWSNEKPYMEWGKDYQHSFALDTIHVENATGFKIIVERGENSLCTLYASMNKDHVLSPSIMQPRPLQLSMQGLSQLVLDDARSHRVCSPTSITAILRYLGDFCDPLHIADKVHDAMFDIYGNWVLNTAEAANRLYGRYHVFATWLSSFDQVLDSLEKNCPVVVSVKGPLLGGHLPYKEGHLMVIRGYDPIKKRVLCVDPAFPCDDLALTCYDLDDFLTAWGRRKGLAYIFHEVSV